MVRRLGLLSVRCCRVLGGLGCCCVWFGLQVLNGFWVVVVGSSGLGSSCFL